MMLQDLVSFVSTETKRVRTDAGVAHTSLAGHAAARLGVTRDQLMTLIDRNTLQAKTRKG